MTALLCLFGIHDFQWPPHPVTDNWLRTGKVFHIECARGCGSRTAWTCHRDLHWTEKHPEPAR